MPVRGGVIERAGPAPVDHVDEFDVRADEEWPGTEIAGPRLRRGVHVGHRVGDLDWGPEQRAHPMHGGQTPIPSDLAREPLSWKSAS